MSITPYMSLSLPTPGVGAGITGGLALNTAFTTVDAHNHSPGSGVQVPTSGINVNADFPFAGYNATALRTSRYADQGSALVLSTDARCVYVAGGNLYYNNGSGTSIQLTAGSALNASSIGGIGGDYATSTASVFYTAGSTTFSFWSDSNKSAIMDCGSIVIREPNVTSPNGITVKSPTSLSAAYSLTLPPGAPASTLPVSMSSAGALSAALLATSQVAAGAITTPLLGADVGVYLASASFNSSGTLLATAGSVTLTNATHLATGLYAVTVPGVTTSLIAHASCTEGPYWVSTQYASANTMTIAVSRPSGLVDGGFTLTVVKL